ncbi:MAG TPA: hypothetical protein VNI84_04060 [Pyrinomonadaceae bacterium]|nr:hypothetical protein [Pyrinomonadaceae bacterium]
MAIKSRKITEAKFWAILRDNGGIFAQTSRAISAQIGTEYSRQAVRDRALKKPDELADIEEQNTDLAEEVLHQLLNSEDERIKADIAKFYLKTKGKRRGYIETQNIEHGGTIRTETEVITPKINDSNT